MSALFPHSWSVPLFVAKHVGLLEGTSLVRQFSRTILNKETLTLSTRPARRVARHGIALGRRIPQREAIPSSWISSCPASHVEQAWFFPCAPRTARQLVIVLNGAAATRSVEICTISTTPVRGGWPAGRAESYFFLHSLADAPMNCGAGVREKTKSFEERWRTVGCGARRTLALRYAEYSRPVRRSWRSGQPNHRLCKRALGQKTQSSVWEFIVLRSDDTQCQSQDKLLRVASSDAPSRKGMDKAAHASITMSARNGCRDGLNVTRSRLETSLSV